MELLRVFKKNERTDGKKVGDQSVKGLEYQIQSLGHPESSGRVGLQIGLSNRVK